MYCSMIDRDPNCANCLEVSDLLQMDGVPLSHQELKDRGLLHK